jgi:type 1 fimbria pilin
MDGNGNAIEFQKEYLLTSYSRTATQQSYTVPMQAAYIQTDSVMKAGTVAAQLTFTLTYD